MTHEKPNTDDATVEVNVNTAPPDESTLNVEHLEAGVTQSDLDNAVEQAVDQHNDDG